MRYIYFATSNKNKMKDVYEIAREFDGLELGSRDVKIHELQSLDMTAILRHKLIETFKVVQQPVIVDHTSLYISALSGLPGVQAGLFWKSIGKDICKITQKLNNDKAWVRVGLAYTDGENYLDVSEELKGRISKKPRGSIDFDWDSIFIPARRSKTFSELTLEEKLRISPRGKALRKLLRKLL